MTEDEINALDLGDPLYDASMYPVQKIIYYPVVDRRRVPTKAGIHLTPFTGKWDFSATHHPQGQVSFPDPSAALEGLRNHLRKTELNQPIKNA
jgi:hypothetical protein